MSSIWKYKYFIDVVENKSFTKAGSINYVSQTAISQNISSLEKSIGGKLLNRGNGEITPTEIGEVVYKRAKEILSLEQQMLREVDHIKNKALLRIGIDSAINKRMWMMVEHVYETYFLDKQLAFTKVDCAMGSLMLESRDLDVFIGYPTEALRRIPAIEKKELCRQPVGIYVGKQTTIPYGEITLDELKNHRYYRANQYGVSLQEEAEEYLKGSCPIIESGNVETMKLKVEFNDGFAFVDRDYFYRNDGEIRSLKDYEKECVLKMYYKTDCNKKTAFEFMEKLREELK